MSPVLPGKKFFDPGFGGSLAYYYPETPLSRIRKLCLTDFYYVIAVQTEYIKVWMAIHEYD